MDQSDPPVWQSEHLVVLADHAEQLLQHLKDYWPVGESSPPGGQPFHDEVITLAGCIIRLPVDLLRLPEPTRLGVRFQGFPGGVSDEVVGAVERIRIIAVELRNAIESMYDTETETVTGPDVAEFRADEDVVRRLEFAAGKLRESISADELADESAAAVATDQTREVVSTEQKPPQTLLTSWREITDALDLRHDEQNKVKSLNKRFDGPIPAPQQGSQPIVALATLIEWWNGLAVKEQELSNQRQGALLSADSHPFGRDGEVVPELRGGVKKRRRDHKR